MEGLPDENNLSLDEFKSNITLTSRIAQISFYLEDNGMDTVFRVYDPYLKTEVYPLDEWVAAKYRNISKWVQPLQLQGMGMWK